MDAEIQKVKEERWRMEKDLAALASLTFDTDLYSANMFEGYDRSIPVNDEADNIGDIQNDIVQKMASLTAPKQFLTASPGTEEEDQMSGFKKASKIIDREDDYRRRRLNRKLSPDRYDPFLDKTPGPEVRTYADIGREGELMWKEEEVKREIAKLKEKERGTEKPKRNRWDIPQDEIAALKKAKVGSDWDLTPGRIDDATTAAPTPKRQRSRWDETPAAVATATPFGAVDMATPTSNTIMRSAMTPEQYNMLRWEKGY